MIDFHSHVLPGVDDGSIGTEMSLKMLRMMHAQQIQAVVATPHFYANHDTPQEFLQRREAAEAQLRGALGEEPLPKLYIGAEVHYFDGISDCEHLESLTIRDTSYLLVEMPHSTWSGRHYRELVGIYQKRGITPIVAHIDRYIAPMQTMGIPDILADLPVLVQANASFFIHPFTRRLALRMLRSNKIHLIGSDCHNLTDRKPNLDEAKRVLLQKLGPNAIKHFSHYEQIVLGNKI